MAESPFAIAGDGPLHTARESYGFAMAQRRRGAGSEHALVLRQARVLCAGKLTAATDVAIKDGRISAIGADVGASTAAVVIDCKGMTLMPGASWGGHPGGGGGGGTSAAGLRPRFACCVLLEARPRSGSHVMPTAPASLTHCCAS
jgi:hypothetical protein